MKSINYLIVELDKAYENEVVLKTGDSLIVNSTIEDASYVNRVAKVVEVPASIILKKGDDVVVHHNIFRLRNGIKGERLESNFFLGGNKYFVPLTEIFMYKRDGGEWKAIDPFCFVKPIPKKEEDTFFSLKFEDVGHKGMTEKMGIMAYPNQNLLNQGVKAGDVVFFSEYSEYEFMIDGELYYKMGTLDILGTV